jgi:hypothetical protein
MAQMIASAEANTKEAASTVPPAKATAAVTNAHRDATAKLIKIKARKANTESTTK